MNDLQIDVDLISGWNFLQWDFSASKAEWLRDFSYLPVSSKIKFQTIKYILITWPNGRDRHQLSPFVNGHPRCKFNLVWNLVFRKRGKPTCLKYSEKETAWRVKKSVDFNSLSIKHTKWSNTLKQCVCNSRRIVWVCLIILWGWCSKD